MLNPWLVFGVAIGIVLAVGFIVFIGLVVLFVDDRLYQRRKRRTGERRSDQLALEGSDAIEAWGEPIPMMWPTRAPRNGNPFDDGGHAEASR